MCSSSRESIWRSELLGQQISHYKITAKLGEGGMGAVYRATDTQLRREVALKILPEKFVRDRQRMGRFQREAEVLASLNHPHISMIHGLEEEGEVRALVLELVEGLTLAERCSEGPIPVEEALGIALEIARALEAAHEQGIIHRDLKPANVKITPEGSVKVLDFGLAKALETEVEKQELANSPMLTMEATREGIVLGTAAYMSPEQARGREVDKRTDIWSFGLVLFEMLTGKGMYAGQSFTETLAAVIHQEPSLEELPPKTPKKIQELLARCLHKDPRMRLRDMGDARITIDECLAGGATTLGERLASPPPRPLAWRLVPWAAVPLLVVVAWWVKADPPVPEKPAVRFQIQVGQDQILYNQFRQGVAFSPDGRRLAFVTGDPGAPSGGGTIYLRSLDQWEAVPLPVEGDVGSPFFSPDGKWLGFYSFEQRKLMKVSVEGGTPTTILSLSEVSGADKSTAGSFQYVPLGASWGSNDTIVFAPEVKSGLWRVSASGGQAGQITLPDKKAGEVSHRLPHLLPGGKAVIFTVFLQGPFAKGTEQIVVRHLESGERRVLVKNGTDGRYVPTGHLVFAREGSLMAIPFALGSLTVSGSPVPVLEGVSHDIFTGSDGKESGAAQFSFSASGSLAYIAGTVFPEVKRQVVWKDRSGKVEPTKIPPGNYYTVRLSPDGSEALLGQGYKGAHIWKYNFPRETRTIQTAEGQGSSPVWTLDGEGFVFGSKDFALTGKHTGSNKLFLRSFDSADAPQQLTVGEYPHVFGSWHPDGKRFVFLQQDPGNNWGIWIQSTQGSLPAQPFLATSFLEAHWARDGKELFYCSGDRKMMAVKITLNGQELSWGNPVPLFDRNSKCSYGAARSYDVSPDGQRFLWIQRDLTERRAMEREFFGNEVSVVLNWFEELERLVPTEN